MGVVGSVHPTAVSSRQFVELFYGQPSLFENGSKGSFCYFFMIRDNKTAVWMNCLSEDYVAALLPVLLIAELG